MNKFMDRDKRMSGAEAMARFVNDGESFVFANCLTAMRLAQLYEKEQRKALSATFSSVMSICENVAVRTFQTKDAALSFGCEDARAFAGISRDRLVAGVPYSMAESLV